MRLNSLMADLSADEVARAMRFYTQELRIAFQRCRATVRAVLGRYVGESPLSIEFGYGPQGKPFLLDRDIHFNVSHCKNVALIAVSRQPLGVDIEFCSLVALGRAALYKMVCHRSERIALTALPAAAQDRLFHQIWTRKEAYFKALGIGLMGNFAAVSFEPIAGGGLLVLDENDNCRRFHVYELAMPQKDYAGALCIVDANPCLTFFDASTHLGV